MATENFYIVQKTWNPASIVIHFPDGSEWEYVVWDNHVLRELVRRYHRNMGKLVAQLRHYEAIKLSG